VSPRRRTSPARYLANLVRNLLRHGRTRTVVDAEVSSHLALLIDEKVAAGMTPAEARRVAQAEIGSASALRNQIEDARAGAWLEGLWRDVRHAVRLLRRAPAFTAVALLTLALGIGANAALFQLIDAVLFRTLTVDKPDELVDITLTNMDGARGSHFMADRGLTFPIWRALRHHTEPYDAVFAWASERHDLTTGGDARSARVLRLSGDAFRALRVRPQLGQLFAQPDDPIDCGAAGVVLSDGFWRAEFAADPAIVGRTLTLSGRTFPIRGVAPPSFTGLEIGRTFDVAVPMCAESSLRPGNTTLSSGTVWWLNVAGRLKPGWSIARASAYLGSISPSLFQTTLPPNYPAVSVDTYLHFTLQNVSFASGLSSLRTTYRPALFLLLGIAGMVLLIACGNLANLLLAQASTREHEIAVRLALGASRAQLVRQTLVYSFMLATLGAALGIVVARILSRAVVSLIGTIGNPVTLTLAIDWRLAGFTLFVAMITCLLFGLAPALRSTTAAPGRAFTSTRGATASRGHLRLRRTLVIAQVAFSLVLLVGAALFVATFRNLLTDDLGFPRDHLLVATFDFGALHLEPDRIDAFKTALFGRLQSLPGADHVGITDFIPVAGSSRNNSVWMADAPSTSEINARFASVGVGYFETLGLPLVRGRAFTTADRTDTALVAVVNETFVRRSVGGSDPVGRQLRVEATPSQLAATPSQPELTYDIIGVVKDAKYSDIREPIPPVVFIASTQANVGPGRRIQPPSMMVLVRSSLPMASLMAAVREAARAQSPQMTISLTDYSQLLSESFLRARLMALVSAFFGGLAALLAAIGLYGVMAYGVAQRQREIGLRLALGATRREVVRMVVREGALLTTIGLVIGVALALIAARTAAALLFDLTPSDPAVYAAAIALLVGVTLAASALPAWRAARVDPARALRAE
jgi:predicted permease